MTGARKTISRSAGAGSRSASGRGRAGRRLIGIPLPRLTGVNSGAPPPRIVRTMNIAAAIHSRPWASPMTPPWSSTRNCSASTAATGRATRPIRPPTASSRRSTRRPIAIGSPTAPSAGSRGLSDYTSTSRSATRCASTARATRSPRATTPRRASTWAISSARSTWWRRRWAATGASRACTGAEARRPSSATRNRRASWPRCARTSTWTPTASTRSRSIRAAWAPSTSRGSRASASTA